MPVMDRDILLEGLSALTDSVVKPYAPTKAHDVAKKQLTVEDSITAALMETLLCGGGMPLSKTLQQLTVTDSGASALQRELFVDLDSLLDPIYDRDFREMTSSPECSRGGEPYTRPAGWYRFALKVEDKYRDGNAWLGSVHQSTVLRTESVAGEWPVSFHGTSIEGAKGIARSHYKAGGGMAFGRGIYSTPDIKVAKGYAMSKRFNSMKTGKTYEVIMQSRVNPSARKIPSAQKNFWLIPVPDDLTAEQEKKLVESSIRPYGILIKEVKITTSPSLTLTHSGRKAK